MNQSEQIDYFYSLSTVLTGYNSVKLFGTGQGGFYFKSLNHILGKKLVTELLDAYQALEIKTNDINTSVNSHLLLHKKWGPVCKNIIKMWYMGNWYQMPTRWRENYVSSTLDTSKVLSSNSYIEGLVWKAMGQHPKSAKQPGYATWSFAPQPLTIKGKGL